MILPLRARTVEALQVAVDDEHQVVELLARGEADRAERLGLVISPSRRTPHLRLSGLGQTARFQVLQVAPM